MQGSIKNGLCPHLKLQICGIADGNLDLFDQVRHSPDIFHRVRVEPTTLDDFAQPRHDRGQNHGRCKVSFSAWCRAALNLTTVSFCHRVLIQVIVPIKTVKTSLILCDKLQNQPRRKFDETKHAFLYRSAAMMENRSPGTDSTPRSQA